MSKLLLVEDNEAILKGLKYLLEQQNFEVDMEKTTKQANIKIEQNIYDLIILDITLPDGSGYELCKKIKEQKDIPIIMLTAKDEERDIVKGFNLGADDYIIKPFRTMELISRINNVLKRYTRESKKENILEVENVKIDLEASRVYLREKEIIFTALEYKILVLLFNNRGKTLTRDKILEKIWDVAGNFVNDNTLTVYIKRIRTKLRRR